MSDVPVGVRLQDMEPRRHIRILSSNVINQIAAGEVVERPSSVVKELMENAVDAGSTEIRVGVTAGGRTLVSVGDNGSGMNRDDALLSVERHATSKIGSVEDIQRIASLGFRGEALAAVASVARFRMLTCASGEHSGTEIVIIGGKLTDVRDAGCPAGTLVEVRDLFFNVPARRKFMRSQQTELSHVRAEFILQALSHPAVGMRLKVDGRDAWMLAPGAALRDRIRDLFGPELDRDLVEMSWEHAGVKVHGFAGVPRANRADRSEEYVFVNGRPTGAPVLSFAIREGYRGLLPSDRHPVLFLFVDLDPASVDVNVHPAKREVRFRNGADIRDAVIGAIRTALMLDKSSMAPRKEDPGKSELPAFRAAAVQLSIQDLPPARTFKYPRMESSVRPHVPTENGAVPPKAEPDESSPQSTPQASHDSPWSWCRLVGQVGGLYVVLETEDGLVLMDPHAAHERVLFDSYMAQVVSGKVEVQGLLMPETVELGVKDAARVRDNLALLKSLGFGIAEFGGDSFTVDAVPAFFRGAAIRDLLVSVAHDAEISGRGAKGRQREEAVAKLACSAAVKAHDKLTTAEIESLMVALAGTELPYTCPHGRPTLIHMSYREINRKFGRE